MPAGAPDLRNCPAVLVRNGARLPLRRLPGRWWLRRCVICLDTAASGASPRGAAAPRAPAAPTPMPPSPRCGGSRPPPRGPAPMPRLLRSLRPRLPACFHPAGWAPASSGGARSSCRLAPGAARSVGPGRCLWRPRLRLHPQARPQMALGVLASSRQPLRARRAPRVTTARTLEDGNFCRSSSPAAWGARCANACLASRLPRAVGATWAKGGARRPWRHTRRWLGDPAGAWARSRSSLSSGREALSCRWML